MLASVIIVCDYVCDDDSTNGSSNPQLVFSYWICRCISWQQSQQNIHRGLSDLSKAYDRYTQDHFWHLLDTINMLLGSQIVQIVRSREVAWAEKIIHTHATFHRNRLYECGVTHRLATLLGTFRSKILSTQNIGITDDDIIGIVDDDDMTWNRNPDEEERNTFLLIDSISTYTLACNKRVR